MHTLLYFSPLGWNISRWYGGGGLESWRPGTIKKPTVRMKKTILKFSDVWLHCGKGRGSFVVAVWWLRQNRTHLVFNLLKWATTAQDVQLRSSLLVSINFHYSPKLHWDVASCVNFSFRNIFKGQNVKMFKIEWALISKIYTLQLYELLQLTPITGIDDFGYCPNLWKEIWNTQ